MVIVELATYLLDPSCMDFCFAKLDIKAIPILV